jgi:AcrR family transcriptional regulator
MAARGIKEPSSPQRQAILKAAMGIFLRYGFKKTSMDGVAQAAGISRQGLYLHFETKDLLFSATLHYLVSQLVSEAREVAEEDGLSPVDRLAGVLEVLNRDTIRNASREHAFELLVEARANEEALLGELEKSFVDLLVGLMEKGGIAARWEPIGVTARQLAEHLLAVAKGIKSSVDTLAAYRSRMRTAIKIVSQGA